MARHVAERRRRSGWLLFGIGAALVACAVVVIAVLRGTDKDKAPQAQSASAASASASSACSATLHAVAASSFAPVLARIATTVADGPNCVRLQITTADGQAAPRVVAATGADVWLPDDASWPNLPNGLHLDDRQSDIVATSPMYLLTLSAAGNTLPTSARSWAGLGAELARQGRWRLVVRDPASSGDGMVAAGVLASAVFNKSGMLASALDLMRAQQVGRTITTPTTAAPTAPGEVGVVPEYALMDAQQAARYLIVAPTDSTALMRFSWLPVSTATADPGKSAALVTLHQALIGPKAASVLASAGLRGPKWPAPQPRDSPVVFPALPAKPFPVVRQHFMWHVLTTYQPAARRANLLIVVDISGSMADPAPGSQTPLIALVRDGVAQVNSLLPDTSRLGLWQFGAALDPPRDYQVLVPTGPLTAVQRARISAVGKALAARRTGTGLYDTILAAYRSQQANFEAGVPNEVLIFTDGVNEDDPQSITSDQLKAGLAAADHHRKVELGIFAFGDRIPVGPLEAALAPVNGQVQPLSNAGDVMAAFVHAVSGGLTE
jgi:hypothetical protein